MSVWIGSAMLVVPLVWGTVTAVREDPGGGMDTPAIFALAGAYIGLSVYLIISGCP